MRKSKSNYWFSNTIILSLLSANAMAGNWFDDSNRGYWFYESKPIESIQIESKSLLPAQKPQDQMNDGEKAVIELEALQKQLKEASALAIMNPTSDNVWNYQQLKGRVFDMAGVMADQSVRNNWSHPDSYSAKNATGGEGLQHDRYAQSHCGENVLRDGSNTYGMYLFVKKDCKYCSAQINVLSEVKRLYDIDTMVVATDGSKPIVPNGLSFAQDNGISRNFGIEVGDKPATVLFNVKTKEAKLLGYGYIPMDDLSGRICRIYTKKVGEY